MTRSNFKDKCWVIKGGLQSNAYWARDRQWRPSLLDAMVYTDLERHRLKLSPEDITDGSVGAEWARWADEERK